MSCCSTGENRVPTGADRGEERLSVSSRKGFVEVGRGGRDPDVAEPAGDRARFRLPGPAKRQVDKDMTGLEGADGRSSLEYTQSKSRKDRDERGDWGAHDCAHKTGS